MVIVCMGTEMVKELLHAASRLLHLWQLRFLRPLRPASYAGMQAVRHRCAAAWVAWNPTLGGMHESIEAEAGACATHCESARG